MLNITSSLLSLLIVLFSGLPGVGKTKLANELAPLIKAVVLSTDKIRKELISNPTYTEEEKELIYDVMLLVARYLHNEAGTNCILDGTFNTKESRRKAKEKLENDEEDTEKKWITTWNSYLVRIKYFFRWLYNPRVV
jgi:predicted kinase